MRTQKRTRSRRAGTAALVLLFVLASPAGAAETLTDPVGDSGTGPDIEQIVLTPAGIAVTVQVTFTALWQPGWSMQVPISGQTCGGTEGTSSTVALPASLAGGTSLGAALLAGGSPGEGWSDETLLDHRIDGRVVTITIPLEWIGYPDTLTFSVSTWGRPSPFDDVPPDQDHSPDTNGCHSVDLGQAVPDTAIQWGTPVWPAILLGLVCLLLAVDVRRRDSGC